MLVVMCFVCCCRCCSSCSWLWRATFSSTHSHTFESPRFLLCLNQRNDLLHPIPPSLPPALTFPTHTFHTHFTHRRTKRRAHQARTARANQKSAAKEGGRREREEEVQARKRVPPQHLQQSQAILSPRFSHVLLPLSTAECLCVWHPVKEERIENGVGSAQHLVTIIPIPFSQTD